MTKIVDSAGAVTQLNTLMTSTKPQEMKQEIKEVSSENPSESEAERRARLREERSRVSLSVPNMKMKVAEIPGFYTHWINDQGGNVQQALRAGYAFVENDEVSTADFSFAGDSTKTGNQDMGSRVSMVVGADGSGGPMRAYLMKLPQELRDMDQQIKSEKDDLIDASLRRGRVGFDGSGAGPQQTIDPADVDKAYVRTVEVSRRDQVTVRPANPSQRI